MRAYLLFILLLISSTLISQDVRNTVLLKSDWKFAKGSHSEAAQIDFDDSSWEVVNIPHDWAIAGPFDPDGNGNTGKLPWKGEGWYRKVLLVPDSQQGKKLILLFDGVMAFPKVFMNGQLVGNWDYGYNSFYLDITDMVIFGEENVLAVHVDTRQHDSRWYPGAGIYRKVQLITVNPVHIDTWGIQITTPIIKPHYCDVQSATYIRNDSPNDQEILVVQSIFNANDNLIAEDTIRKIVQSGKSVRAENTMTMWSPRRWDIDDPYLYTLRSEVYQNGELMDRIYTRFGVRQIRFTADHGFYLNNRRVQLKGVNLHHDHGPLGAAFNKRAMQRQLEIMQEMGCNAIRNSHNTAAPELLELCDEMGLLVLNEIFDKYDAKADILDTTDFENFTERNMRNFVCRDRNHPSIFLWSVGNEIGDIQWNINNGFYRLQTMIRILEKYDPTRPNTLVCDNLGSAVMRHFDFYDVHSWNYDRRYRLARQLEPNKPVLISESASTVSTRGFYEFPLPEEKTAFTDALQVSSYDLNAPPWAEIADDDFMWQQEEPYVVGEFVWTGFDYLGEPTPYVNFMMRQMGLEDKMDSRSSYFGIVDLCGMPKDRYFLYKSYWKPDELTLHILPHWNWEERVGLKVPVFVYTNGDCAELFLNGESLGKKCKQPKARESIKRFRLMWEDVIYTPGTLRVVAYKEGIKIGEKEMKTAGAPTALRLTADRKTILANGEDLSYLLVEAIDSEGNVCPKADMMVDIKLEGEMQIAGVGNGNPQSLHPFQSESVPLFYGKAMIIAGSKYERGQAEIRVTASGMEDDQIILQIE